MLLRILDCRHFLRVPSPGVEVASFVVVDSLGQDALNRAYNIIFAFKATLEPVKTP